MILIGLLLSQFTVGFLIVYGVFYILEDLFLKFVEFLEKRLGKEKAEIVIARIIIIAVIVIVTCLVVSYIRSVVW